MANNKLKIQADFTDATKGFQLFLDEVDRAEQALSSLKKSGKATQEELTAASNDLYDAMLSLNWAMQEVEKEGKQTELTYNQTSKAFARMTKYTKEMPIGMRGAFDTKVVNSFNDSLKKADAEFGVFGRRVGAYSKEMKKDLQSLQAGLTNSMEDVKRQTMLVMQELPSLANSPQQFLMAISNNLPFLVQAIARMGQFSKMIKAVSSAEDVLITSTDAQTGAQIRNNSVTAAGLAAQAAGIEQNAEQTATLIALNEEFEKEIVNKKLINRVFSARQTARGGRTFEMQLTIEEYQILESLMPEYAALLQNENRLLEENGVVKLTVLERDRQYSFNLFKLRKASIERQKQIRAEIKAQNEKTKATVEGAKAEAAALKNATGFGAVIKGLLSPMTVLTVILTGLIIYSKEIGEIWNEVFSDKLSDYFTKGSKTLKEWNKALKEGAPNAAQAATKLQAYVNWASKAAGYTNENALAAKRAVKIWRDFGKTLEGAVDSEKVALREFANTVSEATLLNSNLADSEDKVAQMLKATTEQLVIKAKAQAAMNLITEKYEKVIKAQEDALNRESEGVTGWDKFWSWSSNSLGNSTGYGDGVNPNVGFTTGEDMYNAAVKRAQEKAAKEMEKFTKWMEQLLKTFDPSDFDSDTNGGGNKKDDWYSKWEIEIKKREAVYQESLLHIEGREDEMLKYLDKEWWKYTSQGQEYFKNMIDEYAAHYKEQLDEGEITQTAYEKNMKELAIRAKQYATDMATYIQKLETQYIHPDYDSDLRALEAWYLEEKKKYEDLGLLAEHQQEIDEEYFRKHYDLAKKYRDAYEKAINYNVFGTIEERDRANALADLELWFKDEEEAYIRAGKNTENLIKEYDYRKAKIEDDYRKSQLEKEKKYLQDRFELESMERNRMAGKTTNYLNQGDAYNNLGTPFKQLTKQGAAINGGHNGGNFFDNLSLNERQAQIATMIAQFEASQELLTNLIDNEMNTVWETEDEKIASAQRVSDYKQEMAMNDAEFQMNMDEAVHQNALALWDERTQAVETTFQITADLFSGISDLMEEGTEEAKGFAAAAAMMSAIASSVEAYKSTVGIPYVGPFLAPIAAATALLAGFKQVQSIYDVDTKGKNKAAPTNAYMGAQPSALRQNLPTVRTTGLSEESEINPIRAYVVDKDLSNGMSNYNRRNSNTSF